MSYLGCSLVHLNANAISALSSFAMLCECWLGIPPDTSLFWYYYSPARYSKTIFGGIGLSLRRKCRDEYIKATFKRCWKGAQQKWILVDMHIEPPWVNKLLFTPAIKDQRKEPPMTDRLDALDSPPRSSENSGFPTWQRWSALLPPISLFPLLP
jgi:hypothetical protein